MGTNRPWNWGLAVLKTIKMIWDRPPMTNFKMTVRADCVVSVYNPLLSIKALAPWLSLAGQGGAVSGCGQVSLASKIKQTFLYTKLTFLSPFDQWAFRPHFWLQTGIIHSFGGLKKIRKAGRWLWSPSWDNQCSQFSDFWTQTGLYPQLSRFPVGCDSPENLSHTWVTRSEYPWCME